MLIVIDHLITRQHFIKFRDMRLMKRVVLPIFFIVLAISFSGCSKSYPCPGNGTMKAADLSMFDEDGNPKSSRDKKKKGNGLVNKKEPRRIHRKKR